MCTKHCPVYAQAVQPRYPRQSRRTEPVSYLRPWSSLRQEGRKGSKGSSSAHMWLSCWMCGSVSVWELWWVAAEGEECEGDEGFGAVESECDSGEEPDLGVG